MATRSTAAFFDLDKTIIAKSSTLAFSKPFQAGGLISRRAVLRSAYAQFVYLVGGADHDQMEKMRQFMSQLCAGWDVATVREIVADTLHNIVDPLVYDEAVSLIEEHKLAGRDVVIVSTSGTEVVGRVVPVPPGVVDGVVVVVVASPPLSVMSPGDGSEVSTAPSSVVGLEPGNSRWSAWVSVRSKTVLPLKRTITPLTGGTSA